MQVQRDLDELPAPPDHTARLAELAQELQNVNIQARCGYRTVLFDDQTWYLLPALGCQQFPSRAVKEG